MYQQSTGRILQGNQSRCSEKEALIRPIDQQIILVTGATDGLGRAVATELARQGATLLLHGRSEKRGQRTLEQIASQTGNDQLSYYRADFDSLEEVRGLAERVSADHHRLDVLVNNAGLGVDPVRRVTLGTGTRRPSRSTT